MSRLFLVAIVVSALTAGGVLSSASLAAGPASGAAKKKCTKKVKKKCKKTAVVALKDGNYTYKQASAGSALVNTLTISGKGTKVHIRELFFSSGEDPAGDSCAATVIDFGTYPLKRTGDTLEWFAAVKPVTVPPIQVAGAGGGTATTHGEINVKTLVVNVATNVVMKNANNVSGCLEGHQYEGVQKLKRK